VFRKVILIGALLCVSGALGAAEPKATGGYIGGGFGVSVFDDDGAFGAFEFDDQDTAFQIFGGYKFFRYFAVEGRYVDLGRFSVFGSGFDVSAISVHAVGIIPFGTSGWSMFGQLGFGQVNLDMPLTGSEDQGTVAGGIGVRFHATQNFSLALQTDVYVWQEESVFNTYDMSVGSTQLTFQYLF